MNVRDLVKRRLHNQLLTRTGLRRPEDVVAWMGAVQAQEYDAARWGVGLRLRDATDAALQRAFDAGQILRTHIMRPTWHFVTPADIGWLQRLTGPKVQRQALPYNRRLGLDSPALVRATATIERALRDRRYLTRAELGERLRDAKMPMDGPRLAQVAMHAEVAGVICSGPRRGKQFTYALVAERAPKAATFSRDEALGTLTRRYLQSHGPATVRDLVWWSGLSTTDARRGLDIARARSQQCDALTYWTAGPESRAASTERRVHLLPIYDEYTVAYRDRIAVPHGTMLVKLPADTVNFRHALVVDGQVAGTWRTTRTPAGVAIEIVPFASPTDSVRRAQERAVERFHRFVAAE
jgi:hypothetical protein